MLFCADSKISFDPNRCCQCGVCLAVCQTNALSREWNEDGLFTVKIADSRCCGCNRCVKSCPAHVISERAFTDEHWKSADQALLGYARDKALRFRSSSGGVARKLIGNALGSGFCDVAYCLTQSPEYPWAQGAYLDGGSDPAAISNSMYLPVPVLENLRPLKASRLLVVGTNCQLIAAENFYRGTPVTLIKVCILCKQQKTFEFIRYVAKQHGLAVSRATPVHFRGQGWPGMMSVGAKRFEYAQVASLPFGKRLWCVPGCNSCTNPLGYHADLTLADPWKILKDAGEGKTMVLVRSALGRELLDHCSQELAFDPCTTDQFRVSIDWHDIQRRQQRILSGHGKGLSHAETIRARAGDIQRKMYETLLLRFRFPKTVLKVINKLPFFG